MLRSLLFPGCWVVLASTVAAQTSSSRTEAAPKSVEMNRLWDKLAGADAGQAFQAMVTFERTPYESVAFMAAHLPPVPTPSTGDIERWIGDLNSERFVVREKASRQLEVLGGMAEPAMRRALKSSLTLEVRQRLEKLVEKLAGSFTVPDHLRAARAVEVLERIGTEPARSLLSKYASGAAAACLTREAAAALNRLENGPAVTVGPTAKDTKHMDIYGDPLPAGAVARLGTGRFRRADEGTVRLAFAPDAKSIVTAGGHAVQVWETATGRLMREISTQPVSINAFALSADGRQFAIVGSYPYGGANVAPPGELRIYDLKSGNMLSAWPRERDEVYQCHVALSPDGKHLFFLGGNGVLRVEDIATGKELLRRQFERDNSSQLAVSPDGKRLAISTGLNTHKFYLWEWQGHEPVEFRAPRYGAHWVNFSHDGKLLATVGYFQEGLRVWDVTSGRPLYHVEPADGDHHYWGTPVFTPDGKHLIIYLRHGSGFKGKTELLNPLTGARQALLGGWGSPDAVSADSRLLAFVAGRGARVIDLRSRKQADPIYEGHSGNPERIIPTRHGFVATSGDDNTVRIWDAATGRQRRKFSLDSWVRDIAVSADGKLLAGSSFDDCVHVWDPASGREIYRLAGHGEMGGHRMLRFLPDSKGLLSWGDDFYLRLWDMKTGKARFEYAIRPAGVKIPDAEDDVGRRGREDFMMRLGDALVVDAGSFAVDVGGAYHIFDLKSGREKTQFPSVSSIGTHTAVSPDGKRMLASAWGNYQIKNHPVMLMDAGSGKVLQRWVLPSSVSGPVAFSPDGRLFATSIEEPSRQIQVYEIASGKVRCTIEGHRGRVWSLAFWPDGRRLASGQSDSTVLVWDLTSPEHARKGR